MLKKIDHIAIFVKDLDSAIQFFQKKYGLLATSLDTVGEARLAFLPIGDTQIELIASTTPDGEIAKYIKERGEGMHHIAFEVDNVKLALEKVRSEGVKCVDQEPRKGAHDSSIVFLHPESNYGVNIEFVEHKHKGGK